MKVALYIGDHKKDDWSQRLGWAVIRLVQKGDFANVTHTESILAEFQDGQVLIGGASLRDGGVRTKMVKLNPEHWLIYNVPQWDVLKADKWFMDHDGEPYDERGALASALPIQWSQVLRWFCNQATGAPFIRCSEIFGPSQFAAIVASIGTDITKDFFASRIT